MRWRLQDLNKKLWSLFVGFFSTSTAEKNFPQRIISAVKSYIYMPEEGKCVLGSIFSFHFLWSFCKVALFCPTAFRFPLKLAISCVVSVIGLYQVTAQWNSNNREWVLYYQDVIISAIIGIFHLPGGPFIDFHRGAKSADSPNGSGWKHRQCFSGLQHHTVSRQTRSGQNSSLLHMVCWRWAQAELSFQPSVFCFETIVSDIRFSQSVSESTLKPALSSCSVLHFGHDSVRFGQPGDAHEVHGSPSVRKEFGCLFKSKISKNPWFALNECHD